MSAYCMCCKAELDQNHIPKFCPNCGSKLEGRIASSLEEAEGASLSSGEVRPSVTIPGTPTHPAQNGFTGLGMHGMFGMYGSPAVSEPHFSYSTNGMMMYSGVTYKVFVRDGQYYAQVRLSGMAPDTAPVFPVEPEFFAKISDSITAAGGDSWDGFNKSAVGVMDGESFNMAFDDGNGRKISANGYMAWPENFGAAKQVWNEMFYELYDKHFPNYGKRLSEYQLIDLLGSGTIQMISGWENGHSIPSAIYLVKISKILDTSLDYLLTGKENDTFNKTVVSYTPEDSFMKEQLALFQSYGLPAMIH